ncbi:MAG: PepSY-associated TM helix domain-containing protein [Oceanococcaceae bacterium]
MTVRRWHHRLSRVAALGILLWASSGLIHPLLSVLGPRAASFAPPAGVTAELPRSAADHPPADAVGMRGVRVGDAVLTQYWHDAPAPLVYRDKEGQTVPDADEQHAIALARHYAGRPDAAVVETAFVGEFSSDYAAVNRLLPVWRVRFAGDDALEVHVHTAEDRLGAISDDRRRRLLWVFQTVHTLAPLENWPGLRLPLILVLVGGVLVMSLLGLRMAFARGGRTPRRRLHRWGGVVLAAPLLMWSVSGLWHLIHLQQRGPAQDTQRPPLTRLAGAAVPAGAHRLISVQGDAVWQMADGHFRHAQGDTVSAADVAQRIAGINASNAMLVTGFSPTYAFANRRLPVWQLDAADEPLRFVDLTSARVAAVVHPRDVAEQWSFSTLHKWSFANRLGRIARDGIMSAMAALAVVLALVGLSLRRRRTT